MKRIWAWVSKHEGLIVLVAITVLLRLPSLWEPYWYGDEQIYMAIGQGMRKGLVLYKEITDYPNKPPLIYVLAAAAGSMFWFKSILLVWNVIHVIVVNRLFKQLWGKKKWLVWGGSGAFILLTSLPALEGNIANGEIFMTMPVTLAMLLLWRGQYFGAGLMFALGFLFKIPVAVDIAAAGLAFWVFRHRLKGVMSWGMGLGLPIGLVLGLWQLQGVSPVALAKTALGSTGYVASWGTPQGPMELRLAMVMILTLGIYVLRKKLTETMAWGSVWLVWAVLGATLSGRPYPHYFIQIIIPGLIVIGNMAADWKNRIKVLVGGSLIIGVIGVGMRLGINTYPVAKYYINFGQWLAGQKSFEAYIASFDGRMPRNYRLAYYLKTRTTAGDKIYIWGTQPDVYVMADRLPIGPWVVSFHVKDLQTYQETMEWLEADPPKYVVMMADEDKFEALEQWVEVKYIAVKPIGEARIYRRIGE